MECCFERSTYIMLPNIFRGKNVFVIIREREWRDRAWIKVIKFYIYKSNYLSPTCNGGGGPDQVYPQFKHYLQIKITKIYRYIH